MLGTGGGVGGGIASGEPLVDMLWRGPLGRDAIDRVVPERDTGAAEGSGCDEGPGVGESFTDTHESRELWTEPPVQLE